MRITDIEEVIRIQASTDDLRRIRLWYDHLNKHYYPSVLDVELIREIDEIINRRYSNG